MMVNVLLTPAARLKPSQTAISPLMRQPAEAWNVKSDGIKSLTETSVASAGPLLVTVSIKAPLLPRTMLAEPVRVKARSAGGQSKSVERLAVLLAGLESVVAVVAVAVFSSATGHVALSGIFI